MVIQSLLTALSLTLALGISVITTSTMAAAPSFKQHQETLKEEYKKPPSFLFVLQAKEATLKPIKGEAHRYTMSMKSNDDNLSKIIAFSDRPYRIVETITAKQLKDLWGEGTNSFKADPSNAVLSANGVEVSIVIIEGYALIDDRITLTLVGKRIQEGRIKDTVITIDGVLAAFRCGGYGCGC